MPTGRAYVFNQNPALPHAGEGSCEILMNTETQPAQAECLPANNSGPHKARFEMIPIVAIRPNPDNPRKHFDQAALDELAASIAAQQQVQALEKKGEGRKAAGSSQEPVVSSQDERPSDGN